VRRWGSTAKMCRYFCASRAAITALLTGDRKHDYLLLENKEWRALDDVGQALTSVEIVSTKLCGGLYPTSPLVIPNLKWLLATLEVRWLRTAAGEPLLLGCR